MLLLLVRLLVLTLLSATPFSDFREVSRVYNMLQSKRMLTIANLDCQSLDKCLNFGRLLKVGTVRLSTDI